jgi:hypothetical protein
MKRKKHLGEHDMLELPMKDLTLEQLQHLKVWYIVGVKFRVLTQGAEKSLTRPNSLSVVISVQGTGASPRGPDPENRVGDQAQVGQFLLGCKCPVSRFLSGRPKALPAPLYKYRIEVSWDMMSCQWVRGD